jgi:hypothetical protein
MTFVLPGSDGMSLKDSNCLSSATFELPFETPYGHWLPTAITIRTTLAEQATAMSTGILVERGFAFATLVCTLKFPSH